MGFSKWILAIFLCIFLTGCENESATEKPNSNQSIEVENISASKLIDQKPSNDAKEILKKHEEITGIKAANTSKDIIISVKVEHMKRFQLSKIKKELTKEIEEHFKNFHVELTIDKKIYLELEKLEEKIQSNTIKPTKLGKEIDRITKLSKEKT